MKTIKINAQKDFDSAIQEIIYENESMNKDSLLLFRGQNRDRPLIPSIRRGEGTPTRPTANCVPWLTINWQEIGKKLLDTSKITRSEQVKIDAVMQHYGYRSFFIDVTKDPNIALWFALHKFNAVNTPIYVDDDLKSAVFQWSRFFPSDSGFVYALSLPTENIDRYIDLTQVMPISALRVHKQLAGALYCYGNLESLQNFLIAKIKINSDSWFQESVFNFLTSELFPGPKLDQFYRKLCTIPYFVGSTSDIKLGHPLLGDFPIYAESEKEIIKDYLPLTRIIDQNHPAINWNIASKVIDLENRRYKAMGATRILLYRLILDKIFQMKSSYDVFHEQDFPSKNLLFEFEPDVSLIDLSTKALVNLVRGLWVVIEKNSIQISQIIDNFNELKLDHTCIYSKEDLSIISKECNCENHDAELKIVLEIAQSLAEGILVLKKENNDYFRLEHK